MRVCVCEEVVPCLLQSYAICTHMMAPPHPTHSASGGVYEGGQEDIHNAAGRYREVGHAHPNAAGNCSVGGLAGGLYVSSAHTTHTDSMPSVPVAVCCVDVLAPTLLERIL